MEGRKNFKDLHPNLNQSLAKFLKKPYSEQKSKKGTHMSLGAISDRLRALGVTTKQRKTKSGEVLPGGKRINTGRLMAWLRNIDSP